MFKNYGVKFSDNRLFSLHLKKKSFLIWTFLCQLQSFISPTNCRISFKLTDTPLTPYKITSAEQLAVAIEICELTIVESSVVKSIIGELTLHPSTVTLIVIL